MLHSFPNRAVAGRCLAAKLSAYAGQPDVLVLALPRGGVPVALEVARALSAPLDVFLVRKLGLPGHAELAMGAIAAGGTIVLNDDVVSTLHIPARVLKAVATHEQRELERRTQLYRRDRPPLDVYQQTVILVDDGLATGSTMRAAVAALRKQQPARIVVAVPVAAAATCIEIRAVADELVYLLAPEPFCAVGYWYEDFSQIRDDEVCQMLTAMSEAIPTADMDEPRER